MDRSTTFGFLRNVPLFADLEESDLEELCGLVTEVLLGDGQELFAEGSSGDRAYVIVEGELEILKAGGSGEILLAVRRPGEVIGEMSLLEEAPRMASARARGGSRLLAVDRVVLEELVNRSPTAARVLFQTVVARLRSTTSQQRQNERMAQLGTMTAGVAHELNNPAAAVQRGASQLGNAIGELVAELSGTAPQAREQVAAALTTLAGAARLTGLKRSDREVELEQQLDSLGIPEPWESAPVLAELGVGEATLQQLTTALPGEQLLGAVRLLAAQAHVADLTREVGEGARRISAIVGALKSYSHLDRAPVAEVDLHQGLEDTLLVLRSKLKKNVTVVRRFQSDLPRITAWAGELNQVWTNLIDNAADALGDAGGTITLTTRQDGGWVEVEVADDGPGIPEENQARIFDAFFTTKPPEKGTGLGLDISYRIVADRHAGEMKLFSRPGSTRFVVHVPITPGSPGHPVQAAPPRDDEERILAQVKSVAVVGMSSRPDRPAHDVPAYLQQAGFQVIPVTPNSSEILGQPAVASLDQLGHPVDVVLVFRPAEEVPAIAAAAIELGAKALWLQDGIVNEQAEQLARDAGLLVVSATCIRAAHRRFLKTRRSSE